MVPCCGIVVLKIPSSEADGVFWCGVVGVVCGVLWRGGGVCCVWC